MEMKIVDKIDKATEIINNKIENNLKRVTYLNQEVFTKEIKDMIKVIEVHGTYYYPITKDRYICFDHDSKGIRIANQSFQVITNLIESKISQEYNDFGISTIENTVNRVLKHEKYLDAITEKAEEIINNIVNNYKKETEEQESRLNTVLDALNVDTKPIKHIKVTIEWI